MALGGNEIPGASVFFFFRSKSEREHFCIRFCFCLLAFFFFFFQKLSEMLREDFFLK